MALQNTCNLCYSKADNFSNDVTLPHMASHCPTLKLIHNVPQPAFTCSKLTIETLKQGVFIINFEQVNACWAIPHKISETYFFMFWHKFGLSQAKLSLIIITRG